MFKASVFRLVVIPVITLIVAFAMFFTDKGSVGLAPAQPEEYLFIRMAGIDTSQKNKDWMRLTVAGPNLQQGGGQSGENQSEKLPYIVTMDGATEFDINRRMHLTSDLDLFWGHVMFLLLGESAAKEDTSKYIDHLIRDHESRFSVNILIAKGLTAEDVIKNGSTSTFLLADRLKNITDDAKSYAVSNDVNLLEFSQMLAGESNAAFAPCIRFASDVYFANSEDKDKKSVAMCGYAVFKNNRLVGYLEDGMARGLDFILNEIKTTSLPIKSKGGVPVAMEVISSHSKIEPNIKEGKPSITVTIEMEANVTEIQGSENVFTEEGLAFLKREQERLVLEETSGVVRKMQEQGADIFDFAGVFKRKYTDEWEKMKDNWEEIYKSMEVKIRLYSVIRRTYNIVEPATGKG